MLRQPLASHFAPCIGIQDTLGFWIPRCGFRIPVLRVSGTWILDSNRLRDFGFRKLYSGFQSPGFWIPQSKFHPFRILQAKIFRTPESGLPYMG